MGLLHAAYRVTLLLHPPSCPIQCCSLPSFSEPRQTRLFYARAGAGGARGVAAPLSHLTGAG